MRRRFGCVVGCERKRIGRVGIYQRARASGGMATRNHSWISGLTGSLQSGLRRRRIARKPLGLISRGVWSKIRLTGQIALLASNYRKMLQRWTSTLFLTPRSYSFVRLGAGGLDGGNGMKTGRNRDFQNRQSKITLVSRKTFLGSKPESYDSIFGPRLDRLRFKTSMMMAALGVPVGRTHRNASRRRLISQEVGRLFGFQLP